MKSSPTPKESSMQDVNAEYYDYQRRIRTTVDGPPTERMVNGVPVSAGPLREADPARHVHAEPRYDKPVRRFTTFETETKLYIVELEPTRRCLPEWTDGALTREQVWDVARSTPKTIVLPDGTEVDDAFDQDVADKRAYNFWVSVEASYSDAAYYVPLTFEAWKAEGKPNPYTGKPYDAEGVA
jgi:hypothetical protein